MLRLEIPTSPLFIRHTLIQILYTFDHTNRGLTLAGALPAAQHGLVSTVPTAKPGLDTLVFWGHGTFVSLCDLQSAAMVTLIRDWKRLNPSLKTVEIITCNSRHSPTGYDAYAAQIKAGLRTGFMRNTRNIVVKALPVNVGGSLNSHSILLADWESSTWCYITAPGPTDAIMNVGRNTIMAEADNFGDNLADMADKVAREVKDRQFTLNYGYFNTLRAQLGVV